MCVWGVDPRGKSACASGDRAEEARLPQALWSPDDSVMNSKCGHGAEGLGICTVDSYFGKSLPYPILSCLGWECLLCAVVYWQYAILFDFIGAHNQGRLGLPHSVRTVKDYGVGNL